MHGLFCIIRETVHFQCCQELKRILRKSNALSPANIEALLGPGDIDNLPESTPIPETGTVPSSRDSFPIPEIGATWSQPTSTTSTDEPGEQPAGKDFCTFAPTG